MAGGLDGWTARGGELITDVNAPSKAFGELVEAAAGTPAVDARELRALLDAGADIVVVDARRYEEYHTMSIPTAASVPGAELVLRAGALAPDPATLVVVNCAGRTRSIIGTQSLINAGLPNRVMALRNGTMGWALAGLALDHGQQRRVHPRSRRPPPAGPRSRPGPWPTGPGRAGSPPPGWPPPSMTAPAPSTGSTSAPPRTTRQATWPGSGLRPAGSWCRRPTGSPPSGEPWWCWPAMAAAGPR